MKRCISMSFASAALTAVACITPSAHADSSSVAQLKQKIDATGGAGVPANWDPVTATATAPAKPASLMPEAAAAAASVATRALVANQVPQQTSYYCGPAAVHEALNARGIGPTQSGLANASGTTTNGTDWYTRSSYPVPATLNNKLGNAYYYPTNVSYSPTSAEKATFQTELVSDIDNGYPVVGNAYEVAGGPHLVQEARRSTTTSRSGATPTTVARPCTRTP